MDTFLSYIGFDIIDLYLLLRTFSYLGFCDFHTLLVFSNFLANPFPFLLWVPKYWEPTSFHPSLFFHFMHFSSWNIISIPLASKISGIYKLFKISLVLSLKGSWSIYLAAYWPWWSSWSTVTSISKQFATKFYFSIFSLSDKRSHLPSSQIPLILQPITKNYHSTS